MFLVDCGAPACRVYRAFVLHAASANRIILPICLSTHPPHFAGHFIDEVSCGMHHVVAVGRPLDRRLARPAEHAPRVAFAWGRGSEGQLGVRSFEDSVAPLLVDSLKGRPVAQVRQRDGAVLLRKLAFAPHDFSFAAHAGGYAQFPEGSPLART